MLLTKLKKGELTYKQAQEKSAYKVVQQYKCGSENTVDLIGLGALLDS